MSLSFPLLARKGKLEDKYKWKRPARDDDTFLFARRCAPLKMGMAVGALFFRKRQARSHYFKPLLPLLPLEQAWGTFDLPDVTKLKLPSLVQQDLEGLKLPHLLFQELP